jgi:uncharacterized protein YjbJ (UPF0337 family)
LVGSGRKDACCFSQVPAGTVPKRNGYTAPKEGSMKPSIRNQIKGKVHELKGKVKETAGKVTNKRNLAAKGQNEKLAGKIQKKFGQIEKVFEK